MAAEIAETFRQALVMVRQDQPFEALRLLNQVIEQDPAIAEAFVQRARIRRRLGESEGAIADYTKAIRLAPTAEIYLARALVWLSLAQVKGAIADSQEAIQLTPDLAGAHQLLGKALGLFGDGPGAIAAYKQAARCYIAAKDKTNATRCLEKIEPLRSLPPLPKETAISAQLTRESKLFPATSQAVLATPAAFLQRLWEKYEQGQYQSVLKDVDWLLQCGVASTAVAESVVESVSESIEALCLRGLVNAQLGRSQQAVEDFALAVKQAPDDQKVAFWRGQMRLVLADGYGAVEDFSKLIKDVGPEARLFAQRAQGYRLIDELEKAFKDYANALGMEQENAQLYQQRAEVQQAMGELEGAIADYRQAATLWLNQGNWQAH